MATILSCSAVSAFWQEAAASSIKVGVGYRQDRIEWKRRFSNKGCSSDQSGNNNSSSSSSDRADIKSDTKWKDLNIWTIEGSGKYVTCDNIYLRGSVDYGWITSGKIHQNFEIDGERNSFDESFNGIGSKRHVKGNVWDGKLAVGYQFKWCDESLSLAPVVGYSWHGNELRNDNDDSSYYSDSSYGYDYSSSYSSYSSSSSSSGSSGSDKHKIHQRWIGPFVGFDLDYRVCCDWNLFLSYEYHWADYYAKERFTSFDVNEALGGGSCSINKNHIHGKNAWGNVFGFGVEWDLCDCWKVGLRGEFQWWQVDNARQRTKLDEECCAKNIELETSLKTRVREIIWDSASVVLDFGMIF